MEEINLRKKPNEEMHISKIHEEILEGFLHVFKSRNA